MEGFLLFLGVMVPIAFSPGPANLALAATASAFGLGGALRFYAGILTSALLVVALAVVGLHELLLRTPALYQGLRLAGIAYILYLAWRLARATLAGRTAPERRPRFADGFLLNTLNAKFYLMVAAVLSQFLTGAERGVPLVALWFVAVNVTANVTWLLGGGVAGALVTTPRAARLRGLLFAALLAGTGVYLAFQPA